MGKLVAVIVVSAVFATMCGADKVEVTTPMGSITVRVETDEELKEEVNLATPISVEARIRQDIRVLRNKYIPKIPKKKDRRVAMAILDELEDLTTLLCSYFEIPINPPAIVRPTPMSEASFASFITQLKKESFAEDELNLVRTVAVQAYFTSDQVCQIMRCLTMDEDKVEVVRVCYPKVVDRENAFKLLNEVTFSDSKEAIGAILK